MDWNWTVNTLAGLIERSSNFINDVEARKDVNRLVKACREVDIAVLYELIGSRDVFCNKIFINMDIQKTKMRLNHESEQQFTYVGEADSPIFEYET
jgi:hypothetical protein